MERAVAHMRRAVGSGIEEYEAIRLKGYLLHLRALLLRSHAWLAVEHGNGAGAMEAVKEAIRLYRESEGSFFLQRDASWVRAHLSMMLAQRDLIHAAMHDHGKSESSCVMLDKLVCALEAMRQSQDCFTLEAMRQRSRQATERIKQVIAYLAQGKSRVVAAETIKQIITDDSIF